MPLSSAAAVVSEITETLVSLNRSSSLGELFVLVECTCTIGVLCVIANGSAEFRTLPAVVGRICAELVLILQIKTKRCVIISERRNEIELG